MGECGTTRPVCYAVAYHVEVGHCFFFNSSKNLIGTDGDDTLYNVGIADIDQLTPPSDTSCPFDRGASYTTENGLEFDILCNRDLYPDGGDYCPDTGDWTCHQHANSMQECMDLCSKAHPLCKGISYNADLLYGFGNCYLKSDPYNVEDPLPSKHANSARVQTKTLYNVDTHCVKADTYTTDQSSSKYSVRCYESSTGSQNISTMHATSLDNCLNHCSDTDDCKSVVFDRWLDYGYENCYMQNVTGKANDNGNAAFALRLSTPNSSNSSSKAWIAGPAIGAALVFILLVALGLWWRKSRDRKNAHPYENEQKQIIYEKDQPQTYEVGPGAHGAYDRRYELRDVNSEALLTHEIGRSP